MIFSCGNVLFIPGKLKSLFHMPFDIQLQCARLRNLYFRFSPVAGRVNEAVNNCEYQEKSSKVNQVIMIAMRV